MRIERLSREHDRAGFDCGSEPLNVYLRQIARQHVERWVSKTFVLVREDEAPPVAILGYYTLCVCDIDTSDLPLQFARRLPRVAAAARLGRLAVALQFQRQGLGELLLGDALKRFLAIAENGDGIGLFVDAKDERAREYYEQSGFEVTKPGSLVLFMPVQTVQSLARDSTKSS